MDINNLTYAQRRRIVEQVFEKYRTCKYLVTCNTLQEDEQFLFWKDFCIQVENYVECLPSKEAQLMQERYTKDEYVQDREVRDDILQIPSDTYNKLKGDALFKLSVVFLRSGIASFKI